MHVTTDNPFILVTVGIWLVLEVYLVVRDRRRGKGATTGDLGTRRLIAIVSAVSFTVAGFLDAAVRQQDAWWLPGAHGYGPLIVGVVLMWAGLGLRVWAIVVLGEAFRTTVEVDQGQRVIDTGPYRMIRHPSYAGVMLIAVGYGIAAASWPALVLSVLGPFVVLTRRILVEERALVATLGSAYSAYEKRTKRIIPGLW